MAFFKDALKFAGNTFTSPIRAGIDLFNGKGNPMPTIGGEYDSELFEKAGNAQNWIGRGMLAAGGLALGVGAAGAIGGGGAAAGGAGGGGISGLFGGGGAAAGGQAMNPMVLSSLIQAGAGIIPGAAGMMGQKKRIKNNEPYQAYKSAMGMLDESDAETEAQLGQNYLDTTEGAAIAGRIKQQSMDQRDAINDSADFAGVSDEAKLAGIGKVNESEAMGVSALMSNADRRRQMLLAQRDANRTRRLQSLSQAFNMEQAIRGQNQAAMGQLSRALGGAANTYAMSQYYENPQAPMQPLNLSQAKLGQSYTG
jgi:hypothetical protein